MTTTTFEIGDRVHDRADEDRGIVTAVGPADDQAVHPLNREGFVLVSWETGVRTWTPIDEIVAA